jgi:hypothetical protein
MSQAIDTATADEELELTFVVAGQEFGTEEAAREFINEQQVELAVTTAADILCDVFGPEAVGNAEDYFGMSFEMMVRSTVDAPNSLVKDYSTETPRILGGQTIATIGRKLTQSSEFEQ